MKGWITLHILVHTDETEEKEKLGIEIPEDHNKYDAHLININSICGINLTGKGYCVLYISNHMVETKESPEEIIELIKKSNQIFGSLN
jgi:predicted HTH transcriptional regulator